MSLVVSVSEALKSPGEAFGFALEEKAEPLDFGGGRIVFSGLLSVSGSIVADAEGISVQGKLSAAIEAICARCLKPLIEPICAVFDVRYQKTSEDDEVYLYQGDAIDMEKMIQDHALLSVPIRSVCDSGCKGLCPLCGADINVAGCGCPQEE